MRCHAGTACSLKPDLRCHSSQGQPVQQKGPDISRLDPALQQQWDHAANARLGNIDIKPYSHKLVWWVCEQCPDGHLHRWEASVTNRSAGRGCPQCSGRKVCKHNSLATKAPLVAAQWDYGANDGTPENMVAQSNKVVGWLCHACGNNWSAAISARVGKMKAGCPHCKEKLKTGKRIKHPTLAEWQEPLLAEWDHERNALQGNFPHNTTLKSNKQIFWVCHSCPAGQEHSWPAAMCSRSSPPKPGCPVCAGKVACKCNSLQALYPDIAAEWDYAKNEGQPSNYTAGSSHEAWWFSPQQGSWQRSINSRITNVQSGPARQKRILQKQLLARGS